MVIAHIDTNHPIILEQLAAAGHQNLEWYDKPKDWVMEHLDGIQGIVIRSRFTIEAPLIDQAKDLQFIARVGAGLESIDIPYATSKGIALIAAPEGNRNAVGEHALGMLLSLFNKLNVADREVKQGLWRREANRGIELEGKTVGLIGYGNMGKSFARKLKGFDCQVIFHDLIPDLSDDHATQVSLEELQKRADVLSLHTPWTPRTDKMIDSTFIEKMCKPFWLINTARGKSVVTKDLVAALNCGQVLGAGLDVLEYEKSSFESLFQQEDMPDAWRQLLSMDNVMLSPHIAGWTNESKMKLAQTIVDKILDLKT